MRCYRAEVIQDKLGLTRPHLVALALLLGSDYGREGVRGIGKEHALKLFHGWASNLDPLQRYTSPGT